MNSIPAELWWKIGVFADNILGVRLLHSDVTRLRPERTLLPRYFSWVLELSDDDWAYYFQYRKDFLHDIAFSFRKTFSDPLIPRTIRYRRLVCRTPLRMWPLHVYRSRLQASRETALMIPSGRRTYKHAHEMYRLPFFIVNKLRKKHLQVLALVY